jgi:hypothetical protein
MFWIVPLLGALVAGAVTRWMQEPLPTTIVVEETQSA